MTAGPYEFPYYGAPQDWSAENGYSPGFCVMDREGLWRATVFNKNSRPISGNSDWELVGGLPYVDVTVTPPELVTAPFFASPSAAPGLEVIPAPGEGLWVIIAFVTSSVSSGIAWSGSAVPEMYYGDPDSNAQPIGGDQIPDSLDVDLSTSSGQRYLPPGLDTDTDPFQVPPGVENQPIQIQSSNSISGGDRSVTYRLYYRIVPAIVAPDTPTFFLIAAVDQGDKTFSVNGNATATGVISNPFAVVGSTGNDGTFPKVSATFTTDGDGTQDAIGAVSQVDKTFTVTGSDVTAFYPDGCITTVSGSTGNDGNYTVVSAVLDGGDTVITVLQALPSAVADGNLEEPTATAIVTTRTIPDSTADGWITTP